MRNYIIKPWYRKFIRKNLPFLSRFTGKGVKLENNPYVVRYNEGAFVALHRSNLWLDRVGIARFL